MKTIKPPPEHSLEPFGDIVGHAPLDLPRYMAFVSPLDSKGRYLPYDKLRFRIPQGLDHRLVWSVVKFGRQGQAQVLAEMGAPARTCTVFLTPAIQEAVSAVDRHATTARLELLGRQLGEEQRLGYLLNDLIQDEAISSSQLEGAATTTAVAKDMLRAGRKPRTPDERMILGNFRLMQCAWRLRDQPLSVELIQQLHSEGVEGLDDDAYQPGAFRQGDDVVVEDGEGNVVHQPPPVQGLEARIERFARWLNDEHGPHREALARHPLIKAIVVHFFIGYEHPFRDGNGRVARSLFYWYLFKHGYGAFRYIALSTLLKEANVQYGRSYLYSETDGMDLTYFVDFQAAMILRAVRGFIDCHENSLRQITAFNHYLYDTGLYRQLSDKQQVLLQAARSGQTRWFTANQAQQQLGCAYNTAATALNGLVELGLFEKRQQGREWVFSSVAGRTFMQAWESRRGAG
ncbi:Fic family protein [Pseudomonas sp. NPDC007930]|uniref:Fic family protein n=1 Tax=Pseudomonas sp. NPDC007930 TaxID=3364417 RepID=UPI0036E18577